MNDHAFYQYKYFLEQRMQELPDNSEFVKAYVALIGAENQVRHRLFLVNLRGAKELE